MAELKSTINIEIDGIQQFLDTTVKVEKELLQIEKVLQKQGFKGNEKELKASAKAYRDAMIKASKDVQQAELKRIDATTKAQKTANSIVSRLTIGRGAAEFAQRLIGGLSDIIEKNKETDISMKSLDKALTKVKDGVSKFGLAFLQVVSGPIVSFINGVESITYALAGWDLEAQRNIDTLVLQQEAFNNNIESLNDSNLSQEERLRLITLINGQYGEYLPFLLTEKSSLEDIKIAQDAVNRSLSSNIKLMENVEALDNRQLASQANLNRLLSDRQAVLDRQRQRDAAKALLEITKEQLIVKKELNTLNGDESRKLDDILKAEKLRTEELRKQEEFRQKRLESIRRDASNITGASGDVQAELNKAVAEGRIKDAERLSKELEDIRDAFNDTTKVLKQAEATQETLTRQVIAAQGSVDDTVDTFSASIDNIADLFQTFVNQNNLFEIVNLDSLLNGLTPELADKFKEKFSDLISKSGKTIELFQTPGLNQKEADVIFLEAIKKGGTFVDLFKSLEAQGIKSTIFNTVSNDIEAAEDNLKRLKKELRLNSDLILDQGIEVAKKQKEIDEAVLASQEAIAAKRIEIEKRVTKEALQSSQQIFDILIKSGQADQTDLLLVKSKEFNIVNEELIDSIKASNAELKGLTGVDVLAITYENGTESIQILNQELASSNSTLVDKINNDILRLKDVRAQQLTELEDLGTEFTKRALDSFSKSFAKEEEQLEVSLANKKLDIIDAENARLADQERFANARIAQDRDINDEEIGILEAHTRNIIALEDERYKIEQYLRVGAFLTELDNISKRGGDVEVETKKFQLKERELLLGHYKAMGEIAEEGAIDINETTKKAFLTPEQVRDLAVQTAQAFSDVYSAYVDLQDAIAQKAIDSIQAQLDSLNDAISETTSNIDTLEGDLEGKRSGRREAVLRGISLEQEREKALTEKKIQLEQQLRQAEKKASEERKAAAIAQASINFAIGVTNVWANSTIPYPAQAIFGALQTAALGAIFGLQLATIENQTFAEGGMLDGPSHSQGGIPFTINGQAGFEAEGGEAIMSRRTVDMFKPQLHAMQVASGSKGLYADGGMLGANFGAMNEALSGSAFRQLQTIADKDMYVRVSDIDNLQARQVRVTDITTL